MALSNELISQFVKATKDDKQTKNESTAYGTIVKNGDNMYVKLDGSDLLTPIETTTVVKDEDRVIVTIKDHTAVVTGDLTNPSANDTDVKKIDNDVKDMGNKISEFEIVIANKVSVSQLEAELAKIDKVIADNVEATDAKFETIEGKVAEIDTIKADVVEIEGKVEAHEADFTTLRADIADFKDVTAESIEAIEGEFHTLESDYASFKQTTTNTITAQQGSIDELETKKLDTTTANAKYATIDNLNAIDAKIDNLDVGGLTAEEADLRYASIGDLGAANAEITKLQTEKLDTTTANAKYATIDFSNIGLAAIEKLFTDSGIIKDLVMNEGKVTGELVGVTIKGDLIEGNTVKADKLVILGEDGIYYKLNIDALGEEVVSTDEKFQNGLDGSVIIAQSVTADKVAVTDLVAFGATIGGFHINDHALYTGAKESPDNTTRGIFLGDDGQIAIGDDTSYLRYYRNENNEFVLDLRFGGTTLDETINDLEGRVNNSIDEAIDTVSKSIDSLDQSIIDITKTLDTKVSSDELNITIRQEIGKGIDKVETSTGFKFDEEGLTISKTDSAMTTIVDEDGMVIKKQTPEGEEDRLIANSDGVVAYDLKAKTFLIVGNNSRFEDYEEDGKKQTGCFWIGNTEV